MKLKAVILNSLLIFIASSKIFAIDTTNDSNLYQHGTASLYCELTCKEEIKAVKAGDYKYHKGVLYNLSGVWIKTGDTRILDYSDRVYLISDKKAQQILEFCKAEENTLKRNPNIRTMLATNDAEDVTCSIKPYAVTRGPITGLHGLINHKIVSKAQICDGIRKNDPSKMDLYDRLLRIKDSVPRLEDIDLLNFDDCTKEDL